MLRRKKRQYSIHKWMACLLQPQAVLSDQYWMQIKEGISHVLVKSAWTLESGRLLPDYYQNRFLSCLYSLLCVAEMLFLLFPRLVHQSATPW